MLQGKELAGAIRSALELKNAALAPGTKALGPTALGKALGMAQSSASELLDTGRLAKDKLPVLLSFFADVVGPDHFGLPLTKTEVEFLALLRALPSPTQAEFLERLRTVVRQIDEATSILNSPPTHLHRKLTGTDDL